MDDQETAHEFDLWAGLWLISCAVGRRVVVPRPRAPVYLNLYAALIGDSGIVRKSSAIREAALLARPLLRDTTIKLMNSKMTAERLDRLLHERTMDHGCAQAAIAISELATFMGHEGYTANMPALLTDLYDCHDTRDGAGTQAEGPIVQRDVWVSFLTASTPTWLLKTVNPVVSEGGFTSRCLFICASKPKRRIAWPAPVDPNQGTQRERLLAQLTAIKTSIRIAVPIDQLALHRFRTWYDAREPAVDPFLSTFEAREDSHILRAAAMFAINDGSWSINQDDMRQAISLITAVKKTSSAVFSRAGERSRYGIGVEVMRTILMSAGMDPVPRGIMFRRMSRYIDHTEFVAMLDILEQFGAIQRFVLQNERGIGRPTEYIRGTQQLLAPGLGDRIVTKLAI